MTIYNEMEYLPYKLKFCQENNIDLYIIDNISDDGSWEWLQEHKVPSHRFDTGGVFFLGKLQQEIIRTIHTIKPDWVIYNGCDLFISAGKKLRDEIAAADKGGYNTVTIDVLHFCNTGEQFNKNPFETYFYYRFRSNVVKLIHKYDADVAYLADIVTVSNEKSIHIEGCMLNYGGTKSKENRSEILERRKKAWAQGEPLGHGTHYLVGNEKNWVWEKETLTDIRGTKYNKYVHKLIAMFS